MAVEIGTNGFDYEYPSDVHECGPSGPCIIDDALSHARGHYLNGVDVLWIWDHYKDGLLEMIRMKYWRSPDALHFYSLLQRLVMDEYSFKVAQPERIAVSQWVE